VEDGDLTQQVTASSKDEVGDLAAHFGAMVERLRQIPATWTRTAAVEAGRGRLEEATAKQNAVVTARPPPCRRPR